MKHIWGRRVLWHLRALHSMLWIVTGVQATIAKWDKSRWKISLPADHHEFTEQRGLIVGKTKDPKTNYRAIVNQAPSR
jgi:hypothetical protein